MILAANSLPVSFSMHRRTVELMPLLDERENGKLVESVHSVLACYDLSNPPMMITAMISPFFLADIIYSFINYLHTNVTRVPPSSSPLHCTPISLSIFLKFSSRLQCKRLELELLLLLLLLLSQDVVTVHTSLHVTNL